METREAVTQRPNGRAFVDAAIVPQHDDRPAQVTEEMAEKLTDLGLVDVRPMQAVVETEVSAARTDREAGNHRETIVPLPETQQRGVPPRRPGFAHTGDQEEARFVDEDEVGAQPCSVFFTRDQSRRFHLVMRASSRWSARASGFWWLHPSVCISRPTWSR